MLESTFFVKRFSIWLFWSLYFSIGPFFPYFGHFISHSSSIFKIGHFAFDLAIFLNIVSTLFHYLVFVYNLAFGHECEGDEGVDCACKVEEPFPDGGGLEQVHAFD
jgi:hypothetical protein